MNKINNALDIIISLRNEQDYQRIKEEMYKYLLLFDILENIKLWKS